MNYTKWFRFGNHQNAPKTGKSILFPLGSALCFIFLLSDGLHAQQKLSFSYKTGQVLPIHPDYPPSTLAHGFCLAWTKALHGKAAWHHLLKNPSLQLGFQYWTLGNPEVLGNVFTLQPELLLPIHKRMKVEIGTSIAYFTKTYEPELNPTNIAVGSHLSSTSNLGISYACPIANHYEIALGIGMSHFSNANTSTPNLGVNIPYVSVQAGKKLGNQQAQETAPPMLPDLDKRLHLNLRGGIGMTEALTPNGPKYPIYTLTAFVQKPISRIFRWRAGLEGLYSVYARSSMLDMEMKDYLSRTYGAVLFGGFSCMLSRISLIGQAGPYLYKPYGMNYKLYTKFGAEFYPFDTQLRPRKQWFLGIYVHAHSGQADFGELGVGYVF